MIPTLILVSLIVFFLPRILPGNIVDAVMIAIGEEDQEFDRAEVERKLGLDAPLPVQYGRWMGFIPQVDGSLSGVFQGNLGVSWWRKTSVGSLIAKVWPVTFELGLMALMVAQLIALPIGVLSALRQDTWIDYIGRSFAILCISVPGFLLATWVIVYPAIWWNYMPPIMIVRFTEDPIQNLRMFIIPALVLGMAMSGLTMRITRTMMLEVLRQDYIRTAWSKGLRERVIVVRHALKNALIPVITITGLQLRTVLGGTVIIESIFVLPGMGGLIMRAVKFRDYPLLLGIMFLLGVVLVLINLAVDLTYGYLDPRIRYR